MPRGSPAPLVKSEDDLPNSMVASAASLTRDTLAPRRHNNLAWQAEAWAFYDEVGELRAGANWIGNALSRITLVIRRNTPGGVERVTEGLAVQALEGLFAGDTGRSQMMEALGIHLTVPGESYVVAEPGKGDAPDTWMVLSTDEIKTSTGIWQVNRGDGSRDLASDALVVRIWRSHPRRWIDADSSVRAVLPILREILQLTKHVAATVDSRLAGAGMLLLPSEMSFASPTPDADPEDPQSDPFLVALTRAMTTPIRDRESAAAVVPIVVRAPGAVLSDAKHLSFSTPFDANSQGLREEAIKRLALGMDLPPEIMLGQGDTNHWASWQIEESAIKIHIEPLCELIADAFTRKWLWPILEAAGEPDYDLFIGWDTSDLRVRPNHATEAVELYDRGQLSADALRRETGFDESDAPTEEEQQKILLLKLAMANSDLSPGAVRALGLQISPQEIGTRWQPVPPPEVESPAGRDRDLPQRDDSRAASAILAATELLVLRAIERANNRISKRGSQRRLCTETECESALHDAWVNVPLVAQAAGMDANVLQHRLHRYVQSILTEGLAHDSDTLANAVFPQRAVSIA